MRVPCGSVVLAGLLAFVASSNSLAECGIDFDCVDLEWRPMNQNVVVGEIVEIGLYAVSSDGVSDVTMSVIQVVFEWDPDSLTFLNIDNNGPYDWGASGLPNEFCGINDTWTDGDALYLASIPFLADPALATPEGLLVTTFRFQATSETLVNQIDIVLTGNLLCDSMVLHGKIPALHISGDLGFARVRVTDTPYTPGDGNSDQMIDLFDFELFQACVTGPNGGLLPDCHFFDFDLDLDVDLIDFYWFELAFDQP